MYTVSAHVEKNRIILDEEVILPDGLKVQVLLPAARPLKLSGLCGIWQDERTAEEIVQDTLVGRTVGRTHEVFD